MISHKHKFIFLHIPKTAGLSLVEALSKNSHSNDFKKGHFKLQRYFDSFNDTYDLSEYFIFSIFRNPFERSVSAFNYLKQGGLNDFDKKARDKLGMQNLSFKEFVLKYFRKDLHQQHFIPQVDFIGQHFNMVNFIGKFENLQEDFNTICDKIGIPQQKLPHKNKSNHKHYTEYYDEETKQIVAEKYARDIEYFGYEFGE
jgi:hypothetical protein